MRRDLLLLLFVLSWGLGLWTSFREGLSPSIDGRAYLAMADSLDRFGIYSWGPDPDAHFRQLPKPRMPLEPCAEYEPLHPVFLALCGHLGGGRTYAFLASALVAASFVLWVLAGRLWMGPQSWIPWAAGFLLLCPNMLYEHVRTYGREPLFCALTAASAWGLTRAWRSGRLLDELLGGACLGLAILAKSVWLPLVPGLVVLALAGPDRRVRGLSVLRTLAICAAVVLPWTIRNLIVLRSPVLVSSLGGMGFMDNTVPGLSPWGPLGIPEDFQKGRIGDEAGIDREIYRLKLKRLAGDPGLGARILATNALLFAYPIQTDTGRLNPVMLLAGGGLLVFLFVGWRPPPLGDPLWIPLGMGACYVLVSLCWQGKPIYRTPVEPLLLMGGLVGWSRVRPAVFAASCVASGILAWLWTPEVRVAAVALVRGWL